MDNFYEKNHQNCFDSTSKIDSDKLLSSLAKSLSIGDSIFDIGCGSGRDLLWVVQQGYEAVGFEESPALVPGGLLFITMKEGDGFSQSDDGRVFIFLSQKDLEQVFANQHLPIFAFSRQTSKIRSDDVWLGYVLRLRNAI